MLTVGMTKNRRKPDYPDLLRTLTMAKARKISRRPLGSTAAPVPAIGADRLLGDVRALIEAARQQTAQAVNSSLHCLQVEDPEGQCPGVVSGCYYFSCTIGDHASHRETWPVVLNDEALASLMD
jgi:hypothetical protein